EVDGVELLAGGVDLEVVGGPPIERGVEVELHRVALDEPVAAAEGGGGALRVVADGAEIEVLVVPEDAEGSADGRRASLVGRHLREAVVERSRLPRGFVHAAVDLDARSRPPRGMRGADERRLRRQLLLRLRDGRRCRREEQQGCPHLDGQNGGAGGTFHGRSRGSRRMRPWYL